MSVVVAIKEGNKVYLGCDSQVTKGGTRTTLKNPNNYKIWKVLGADNCLMASVGNVRDANIVRLMDRLVTDYNIYKQHVDYEFVVSPNPCTDYIRITANAEISVVEIIGLSGAKQQYCIAQNSAEISMVGYPKGIYSVRIQFVDGTSKVVSVLVL